MSTFMRMSRGCDIAIGSVVIISSLNHLGRVGTAAYAEDLVDALHTFRQTFSGQIRAVHGFPISASKITDQFTIRALVEIEAWLDTVDLRRAHSLPESSQYFKDNILACPVDQVESNMCATPSIPLRMPASLFTKDRTAFVGLGWSNIATALPPMTSLEEKAFLSTLLQELNLEFALQLDISPKVDRLPHTPEVSGSRTLIFGGGSHAGRLAAAVGAIYPEVVDLTFGGWKLSEKATEDLAYDIENVMEDLDPTNVTLILNILDNNIYRGNVDGQQVEPVKLDSGYHIPGKLEIVDAKLIKELFDTAMPVLRAARGAEILIVGPLQRYLEQKCCSDINHITNFTDPDYATSIAGAIKEVGIHLRNLLHTRRLKGVKLLNPAVLMGMSAGNAADSAITTSYWGRDPVHPLDIAYTNMAKKILEEVNEKAASKPAGGHGQAYRRQKRTLD